MSEGTARTWLSQHHDIIPALEIHHRRALQLLRDRSGTLRDLADVIALDPGMSLSLYHELNGSLRGGRQQHADSVHDALSLLGDSAIADLVMQHRVLNETHPDALLRQSFQQLMSRSYHLLAQLDGFVKITGTTTINEIRSAALLHNIGEYCACLFDHERYQIFREKYRNTGSDANSARAVYGFDFHQLGRVYAEKASLPPLVAESLDEHVPAGQAACLIQLAADISHQAEIGWYHSAIRATEEICATYLEQPLEAFQRHLHRVALACARRSPFDDVLPAASRLIMLPDLERPAGKPHGLEIKADHEADKFESRIKTLLRTHKPTPAQLLDLLLDHLHDDLHLTRVALLLISRDHDKLGTRAARGIDEDSPIRTLVIDIGEDGLPRSMLGATQALWVKPDTYPEFSKALPARFRTAFLHESFLLMPLHLAGRPIGMIYADRSFGVNPLDMTAHAGFESAIRLAGKVLAYLARSKVKVTS